MEDSTGTKDMAGQIAEGGKIATETIGLFEGESAKFAVLMIIIASIAGLAALYGAYKVIHFLLSSWKESQTGRIDDLKEEVRRKESHLKDKEDHIRDIINRKG